MGNDFRSRNKQRKSDLAKQHKQQMANKDGKDTFPTIFIKDKIPEGIGFWKCDEGEHTIDIIPWNAGKNHPMMNKGDLSYVLEYFLHAKNEALRKPFACLRKNWEKDDPICEHIENADPRLSKEDWLLVAPKRRTVYLIWVHDSKKEEKKGLQLWDVAHFFMEEHLVELAKLPKGGGSINFSDYDNGKTIMFTRKGKGATNTKFTGHRFVDREKEIPSKLLDQTFALDSIIDLKPSYDEMKENFVWIADEKKGKKDKKKKDKENSEPEKKEGKKDKKDKKDKKEKKDKEGKKDKKEKNPPEKEEKGKKDKKDKDKEKEGKKDKKKDEKKDKKKDKKGKKGKGGIDPDYEGTGDDVPF